MKNKRGFTLSELLIVVAIIAVLVAIAIPVFNAQLHKSRVAVDWANTRAYFAELQLDFLENGYDTAKENEIGKPGLTELTVGNQTLHLEEGSLWVQPEDNHKKGYNILYRCDKGHLECQLILPTD